MILEKIEEEYKSAMKEKNELKVSTLRMLKSAIQYFQVEKVKKEATDEDILGVISKQIKQRRDSIEEYKKANRQDLASKEERELNILQAYLPAQLSAQELETLVNKVLQTSGLQAKADMGKVMKLVMEETKGRADGKAISSLVSSKLK